MNNQGEQMPVFDHNTIKESLLMTETLCVCKKSYKDNTMWDQKDRQYNGQMKKDKHWCTKHRKLMIEQHQHHWSVEKDSLTTIDKDVQFFIRLIVRLS